MYSLRMLLKMSMIEVIRDYLVLQGDLLISPLETPYKKWAKKIKSDELGGQTWKKMRFFFNIPWAFLETGVGTQSYCLFKAFKLPP